MYIKVLLFGHIGLITFLIVEKSYYLPYIDESCRQIISPSLVIENKRNFSWWPNTYKISEYKKKDVQDCFTNSFPEKQNISIAFLGDSHQRSLLGLLFEYMKISANTSKWFKKIGYYERKLGISIHYNYFPTFNNSYRDMFKKFEDNNNYPDLLIIGCNLHPQIDFTSTNEMLHNFRHNLTLELPILNRMAKKGNIIWYVQPPVKRNGWHIRNKNVDLINTMVIEVLKESRVHLWTAPRLIGLSDLKMYKRDGVHLSLSSVRKIVLLLLNFHCNSRVFSNESVCCLEKRREINNYFNKYSCFTLLSALTLCCILIVKNPFTEKSMDGKYLTLPSGYEWKIKLGVFCSCIIKFIVYFGFIYICDRTPLLDKQEKYSNFAFISFIVTLFSFLVQFQSVSEDKIKTSNIFGSEDQGLLILMLIFLTLVEDSKVGIMAKLLESLLLIHTGFRIFQEFWRYEHSIIYFYLKKIVQLNSLFLLMCFIMNQSSQFYGLSLVLTASFTICFIVLAIPIGREKTATNFPFMALTFKFAAMIYTLCFIGEVVDLKIFSKTFLRPLFETKDSFTDPWIKQWEGQKYSLQFGLCLGFIGEFLPFIRGTSKADLCLEKSSKYLKVLVSSIVLIPSVFLCSVLPWLLSYDENIEKQSLGLYLIAIMVIMISRWLLSIYKSIYFPRLGALGDSWIEIYLLHFHVFLANNGTAILQFISFSEFLNELIISSVVIILSLEIHGMINFISNIYQ